MRQILVGGGAKKYRAAIFTMSFATDNFPQIPSGDTFAPRAASIRYIEVTPNAVQKSVDLC
jgi:hypothetical protein